MIVLDFKNTEELLFELDLLPDILPELKPLHDAWKLGKMVPSLDAMRRQAVLDLMNSLDENQLEKISSYIETPVAFSRLDYRVAINLDLADRFPEGYQMAPTKNNQDVKITFWK